MVIMIEITTNKKEKLSTLFRDYHWNYLVDAVLDGAHGHALAESDTDPQVAVLVFPKIKIHLVGGDPGHPAGREYLTKLRGFQAIIFVNPGWDQLLESIKPGQVIRLDRYAFTSHRLDIDFLRQRCSQVPVGYRLARMDLALAKQLAREHSEFASDHMVNFDSPEDFIDRGFGFCVLSGEEIVSVATTFLVCNRGIEIQINTREAHQRKGLATIVAAQLLVYSLELGLDPNWDAANERSSDLARKLGYTPQGTYPMFLLAGPRALRSFVRSALKIRSFFKK
jgi:RimJ/RimL family protein N-acetyltransferase